MKLFILSFLIVSTNSFAAGLDYKCSATTDNQSNASIWLMHVESNQIKMTLPGMVSPWVGKKKNGTSEVPALAGWTQYKVNPQLKDSRQTLQIYLDFHPIANSMPGGGILIKMVHRWSNNSSLLGYYCFAKKD